MEEAAVLWVTSMLTVITVWRLQAVGGHWERKDQRLPGAFG